jgi:RNA polymerase sigma factor (sigma-70 family)
MDNGSMTDSTHLPMDSVPFAESCSEAMQSFIRAEWPALLNYLRRRISPEEDAEEAVQDSFMRLLRYQHSKPAFAWRFLLYRIAANVATDHARHAKSHYAAQHVQLDELVMASSDPSQERVVSGQQELLLLRAAILELPPKCRQVFLLNRMHGMSYSQIARHCGISVKMVERHIHKAVTRCLAKVDEGR